MPVTSRLLERIEKRGWQARLVPIGRLPEIKESIHHRYKLGHLDQKLFHEQLESFSFLPPPDLDHARSIIIIAAPTLPVRVFFNYQGKRTPVIIPPTYVGYSTRTESVQTDLTSWFRQEGYGLAKTQLPLKTVAVGSGLAEYGRNNICYVRGMGSFFQLVGAFTDLACDHDPWQAATAMARCDACRSCQRQCPTGAIADDRFLLYAERCLTRHNEAAAALPDWIDPTWHHCLIGCMRCQSVCPENKNWRGMVADQGEFSEQETELLINHTPFTQLPIETMSKWRRLEINEDYRLLCRNLGLLIK